MLLLVGLLVGQLLLSFYIVWYDLPTNSPTNYPTNNGICWIWMRKKIGLIHLSLFMGLVSSKLCNKHCWGCPAGGCPNGKVISIANGKIICHNKFCQGKKRGLKKLHNIIYTTFEWRPRALKL
jgi:hypothetical protein